MAQNDAMDCQDNNGTEQQQEKQREFLQRALSTFFPNVLGDTDNPKNPSDESLFAGLLLLAKVLDPNDPKAMDMAYVRMPWSFIVRLLSDNNPNRSELQPMALTIIHGFLPRLLHTAVSFEARGLFSHHAKKLIACLWDLIVPSNDSGTQCTMILGSIAQALVSFHPIHSQTYQSILDIPKLCTIITAGNDEETKLAMEIVRSWLVDLQESTKKTTMPTQAVTSLMEAVLLRINAPQKNSSADVKYGHNAVNNLISYLQIMILMIGNAASPSAKGNSCSWQHQAISTVSTLIQHRLAADQRDCCMSLLCMLHAFSGHETFFASLTIESFSFLLHTVCTEMRLLLDRWPEKFAEENYHMHSFYCELLHGFIKQLGELSEEALGDQKAAVPLKLLDSMRIGLGETFLAIGDFALECHMDGKHLDKDICITTVRILCFYLAEETSVPQKFQLQILPCIMHYYSVESSILPSVCRALLELVVDPEILDIFISEGGIRKTIRMLESGCIKNQDTILLQLLLQAVIIKGGLGSDDREWKNILSMQISPNSDRFISFAHLNTLKLFILRYLGDNGAVLDKVASTKIQDACVEGLVVQQQIFFQSADAWLEISEVWFLGLNLITESLSRAIDGSKSSDALLTVLHKMNAESLSDEDRKAAVDCMDALKKHQSDMKGRYINKATI